jgi:hypothetical protein
MVLWLGLALVSCVSCSRGRPQQAQPQVPVADGLLRWTEAFYFPPEGQTLQGYWWWVGESVLARARRERVPARSVPALQAQAYVDRGVRNGFTDGAIYVLSACAAHRFAPLILERSDDEALRALGEDLAEWGEDLDPVMYGARVPVRELAELGAAHSTQRGDMPMFDRLTGKRRDRPPSIDELGLALAFGAEVAMHEVASRAMIDPGMYVRPPQYYLALQVPLTLAPLYAASAGADPDDVWPLARECLQMLADAQRDKRLRVQYYHR